MKLISAGGGGAASVSFPLQATSDGAAATPAYSFASQTDMGLFRGGSNDMTLQSNQSATPGHRIHFNGTLGNIEFLFHNSSSANPKVTLSAGGAVIVNDGFCRFSSTTNTSTGSPDIGISRGAAGLLHVNNGATFSDFSGAIKLGNATLTSAAPTVAAAQVGVGSTTATTATAGANGATPAQVAGYWIINVAGTAQKVPYYNT